MSWAKLSVTWYLATLSAVRNQLRETIRVTEGMFCTVEGEMVCLDPDRGQYPPGTEVRWTPIKRIEAMRKEVMDWYNVLCRVVGLKERLNPKRSVDGVGNGGQSRHGL